MKVMILMQDLRNFGIEYSDNNFKKEKNYEQDKIYDSCLRTDCGRRYVAVMQ